MTLELMSRGGVRDEAARDISDGPLGGPLLDETLEDIFVALINGRIEEALDAVPDLSFMTVPYLSKPDYPPPSSLRVGVAPQRPHPAVYPLVTPLMSVPSGEDDGATSTDSEEWSLFDAPVVPQDITSPPRGSKAGAMPVGGEGLASQDLLVDFFS